MREKVEAGRGEEMGRESGFVREERRRRSFGEGEKTLRTWAGRALELQLSLLWPPECPARCSGKTC